MGNTPSAFAFPPRRRKAFPVDDGIDKDLEEGEDIPVGSCDECKANLYAHDDGNLCAQCAWWRRASG